MSYVEPLLTVFWLIGLVGWFRLRRHKGSWIVGVGLLGIFVISWPPCAWLLARPLELWYPIRPFQPGNAIKAIVVLASGVEPPLFERPYTVPDSYTYQRCRLAAWLYTRYRVPILAAGGRGGPRQPPYARTMRELLEQAGVPATMIWTEERSRSTHENALFAGEILVAHHIDQIALVVEASSMPRAAASFRKIGIQVQPAPSEFRQLGPLGEDILPSWKAVGHNELALHEFLGLGWYALRGWI